MACYSIHGDLRLPVGLGTERKRQWKLDILISKSMSTALQCCVKHPKRISTCAVFTRRVIKHDGLYCFQATILQPVLVVASPVLNHKFLYDQSRHTLKYIPVPNSDQWFTGLLSNIFSINLPPLILIRKCSSDIEVKNSP